MLSRPAGGGQRAGANFIREFTPFPRPLRCDGTLRPAASLTFTMPEDEQSWELYGTRGNQPRCEEGLRMSKHRVFSSRAGSGLIGFRLAKSLQDDGHEPIILFATTPTQIRRRREMWPFRIVQGDPSTAGSMAGRARRLRCRRESRRSQHVRRIAGPPKSSGSCAIAACTARSNCRRDQAVREPPGSSFRGLPSAFTVRRRRRAR